MDLQAENLDLIPSARTGSPPITDSPWLWLALFTAVGLSALLATGGKFGYRQSGIERRYQARAWQARSQQTGGLGREDGTENAAAGNRSEKPGLMAVPDYSTPKKMMVRLWPLASVLGALCVMSLVMLRVTRRQEQR